MPSTKPWSRLRAELERDVDHDERARAAGEKGQGEIEAYHASLAQLRRDGRAGLDAAVLR